MLLSPLPGETVPFTSRVADFYRAKGYEVRQNARVRGGSGKVYAVEMVCSGPLGALLVSFGDAAGVDGPEIGRVRTLARDIGATPVIACPELLPELRHLAAQYGVVVVDAAALHDPNAIANVAPAPDPAVRDLQAHPWPASGRARPDHPAESARAVEVEDILSAFTDAKSTGRSDGDGLWKKTSPMAAPPVTVPQQASSAPGAAATVSPEGKFSWLAGTTAPAIEAVTASAPLPLTSAVLGRTPVPAEGLRGEIGSPGAPAIEHVATIQTRAPTIPERAADLARDATAGSLWKFAVGAIVGAVLLFVGIRLLA